MLCYILSPPISPPCQLRSSPFSPVGCIWDQNACRNTWVCGLWLYCSFPFQALTSVVNYREPKSICKAPELVCNHYLSSAVRSGWPNKLWMNINTPSPLCRCFSCCGTAGQVLWQSVEEVCERNDGEWSGGQTDQLHHRLQIHWWQRCVSEGEAMAWCIYRDSRRRTDNQRQLKPVLTSWLVVGWL